MNDTNIGTTYLKMDKVSYSPNYIKHNILSLFLEPPSPPQGLQVLEMTSTSVRLNWQIQNQQPGLTETSDTPRINKYIVELAEIHGKTNIT